MANRRITYEVGFTSDTSQLQAALKQAVASLKELGKNPQNLQKGLEGAAHAALELTNHLRNAYNADTGKLDLTRFRQELDKSGKSLEDYAKELRMLGPAGEQAFMEVATAIGAAELPLKRSNQLLNQLWITMKNTARWRLTTGALNSFIGGLQQAFGYAKSLDASLNDIRIVTNKSADEMARFAKEANQAAKELSTTTTTYTDASLIYYQQGLDDKAVKERTDATIKMANVTGQSAETISSQMTAVWNNFREGSRTLESYADTMVALGASTASSSKEIAEGLEKFAPIADSVGLSFDYASAALATLVATTRESASVAGNALKTLFSRLEGLKLGETLEDGTDLNKYSQALYTVGINIKDANGELKDMDLILSELGNRWKDLARDEQMALAQTVGGVRQYAQLVALMDNWQTFQQNLTTARTAEGSLEKQAQIHAESWEASRDRVKAAAEDVYDSLINPKVFIDLDKMSQAVLKPLASVLDAVGGLTGLLPIVAALMTKVYSSQIAGVIRDMAINIGLMTGKEQERVRILQSTAAKLTEGLYSTYDDKSSASAKLSILRDYVSLQGELNVKADQYNEFQMEQIKNGLAMVEVYKSQALASQDILEKTQGVFDETQAKFDSFIRETAQLGKINTEFGPESQYQKILTDLTLIKTNWVDLTNSIKNGDTKQFLDIVNDGIDQMAKKSVKLETLKNILGETDQEAASWKKNVIDLANELGLLGDGIQLNEEALEAFRNDPEIFEELRKKVSDSGEASVEVYQNFQALFNLLELGTGNAKDLQTVFYGLINRTKELAEKGQDAETSLKAVTEMIERLRNYKPQQEPIDFANSFVAIANGASQAAMAVRSVTNIIETFSDTTISASERLTRSLTSLAMILPVITNTIQGIAAGGAAAIGGWATIAVTAIVVIVKVLDKLIVTQKEASKAIQESVDAYKEATSELESFQSELKTTQDRIKELQELAASGSISIVEQEELRDLQIENDKLKRQLELKKELARIKFTETYTQYQQSGGRAYVVPEKDSQTKNYNDIWQTLPVFGENQLSFDEKQGLVNLLASGASLEEAKGYLSAAGLNDYYETLVSVYDQIETIREKNDAEWLNSVGETLSQAESLYDTFLENIDDFSDIDLRNLQKQITELRKAFYGDQYGEKVVSPILGSISQEDLNRLKGIYESNNEIEKAIIYQEISQETKDLLVQYGVATEDVGEQFANIIEQARTKLSQVGFGNLVDSLGYQELNLIAKFEFQEDSEFTEVQQLFNFLRKNAGIVPISFQVQTIEDARTEALTALASGEMLSDEMITKLQEVYTSFKDIANFNDLSIKDQIEFLTNEGKIAHEELDILQTRRDNLKQDIDDLEYYRDKQLPHDIRRANKAYREALNEDPYSKKTSEAKEKWVDLNNLLGSTSIKLELELKQSALKEVESEIEALKKQIEKEPWQLNIELGNEIAAELNNAKKAIALINDDLTVSAENLVELGKRYPEILEKAWYDESQNVLKINQNTYDQLRVLIDETLDHDRQANRDAAADKLLAQAQLTDGIIKLVTLAEGETRDEKRDTLIQALQNDEDQLASAKSMALQSMLTVVRNEAIKRQNYLNTLVQQQAGDKTTTDTMKENARINVENQAEAATEILRIFDDLFQKISNGSKDAFKGDYTSLFSHYTSNYSGQQGVTYQEQYTKNVQDIRDSADYKLNELALNYTNNLANAIQGFLNEEKTWDEVQKAFYDSPAIFADAGQRLFGENFAKIIETGLDAGAESFVQQIEDYYGNNDDALAVLQEIRNQTIEALARLLESPDSTKDKSSGSGKTDFVKLDKADLEAEAKTLAEIEDRYHEITREIERQGRVLDALDHQIERTYGLNRLDLYKKKVEELTKKQEDQIKKSDRASRYRHEVDKPRLVEAFKATGFDIESHIDEKTGELKDFETIEAHIQQSAQSVVDSYTTFMEEYNKWAEEYEQMDDETKKDEQIQKEAENWKTRYEAEKKTYDDALKAQQEQLDAIKQYEDTLGVINTLAHDIEETARQIEDAKLNEITYRMDVILDVKEARKMIRDFTREIAESFGDALTHGLQVAELDDAQAKDEMAMYKEYMQEYQELQGMLAEATDATDKTAIMAELKELEGNIIASGEALLNWIEKVENMFTEALNAASERFSELTSQLEHNDAILATIKELYALQGQTYKTAEGYARLQAVSQQRLDAQIAQSQLQRKWYENADAMLQQAQAELDALIAEYGSELDAEQDVRYDALKKNRDALLQEQQEAQKQMLSYAQAALETLRQMQLDEIQRTVYEMDQKLSGGVGLDFLQEKYDHFMEEQERYLDPVEEGFETTKWYSKLQADIDKTSNNLHKEKLKSLQQEIDLRRENNTLTKYDLELLEAKYKVLQATMDLEDAQNNKTQLRLVRDSRGNWNYQYTADESDVQAKEQALLQAKQEEYGIAKKQNQDLYAELFKMASDYTKEYQQILEDQAKGILSTEEAEAKLEELQRYYEERSKYLQTELGIAETDLGSAALTGAILAAGLSESVYETSSDEIKAIVDAFKKTHVPYLLEEATTALGGPGGLQETLATYLEDFEGTSTKIKQAIAGIITTETLDGQGTGFEGLLAKLKEEDSDLAERLQSFVETFQGKFGDEGIKGIIGELTGGFTTSMEEMGGSLKEKFVSVIQEYVPIAKGLFEDYGAKIEEVTGKCGIKLGELDSVLGDVRESTQKLAEVGPDAVEALWQQTQKAWDAQKAYLAAASAVKEYIDKLLELAKLTGESIAEESKVSAFDEDEKGKKSGTRKQLPWEKGKGTHEKRYYGPSLPFEEDEPELEEDEPTPLPEEEKERKSDWPPPKGSIVTVKGYAPNRTYEVEGKVYQWGTEEGRYLQDILNQRLNEKGGVNYARDYLTFALKSGGYTGEWGPEGKFALLHEKELVLNAQDTEKILAAVNAVRDLSDGVFSNIAAQLDKDGFAAMALLGARMGGFGSIEPTSADFNQTVTIESVSFPGVTSSREIEEAFENLVNDAAQWARRRKG